MATVFKVPSRVASFPGELPVFKISDASFNQDIEWRKKMEAIRSTFGFKDPKLVEERDSIFVNEGPLTMQLFKASNSFLFQNRDLICPTTEDINILPEEKARGFAIERIRSQNLFDGADGKRFQIFYEGVGYTQVQTAQAEALKETPGPNGKVEWSVTNQVGPLKTETQLHFGFLLGGLPVFGPGAKAMVSYVGSDVSEELYFWKNPVENIGSREIIAPKTAMAQLCKDRQFVQVAKVNKNNPSLSNGRFHDDVELGYYATPPFNQQRFFIPVYKIRGTFESRSHFTGLQYSSLDEKKRTFRYDFVRYVSAMHGEGTRFMMDDFTRQIVNPSPIMKINKP